MSSIVQEQSLKNNQKKMSLSKPANSRIAYRTCFSSVSHHGYKLDMLKSGMQKYLRRREFEKMTWCVMEIFKFELWAKDEKEKKMSKGIISNLLNRIIVMMDEELLFCEINRYLLLRKFIEKFDEDRKNGGKYLILICKILTESSLLRRASDIRAYWDYRIRFGSEKDAVELSDEEYFNKFVECFERKDYECFKWMFKIFNGGKKGDVVRFRRKENIYMIWEYLFSRENIKENKYFRQVLEYKLREFYKLNRGERFMFLVNSIDLAMVCNCSEHNLDDFEEELVERYDAIGKEYEKYLRKSMEYMTIDGYAIDMHTSMGRKMGKNRKDFALEGSIVVNEDLEYLEKEWRDFYVKEKLENPVRSKKKRWEGKKKVEEKKEKVEEEVAEIMLTLNPEKVEEKKEEVKKTREEIRMEKYKRIKKMRGKPNFDDLEKDLEFVDAKTIDVNKIKLCSDTTCGNKVMCFEYEGKIWKESRKSMNYNRDYCVLDECKEAFGLRKIGMKRVLSNFRIEKNDRTKKSWKDNWKMVSWGPCVGDNKDTKNKVVYCVMNKITNCMWKVPMEFGKIKHSIVYGAENGGNIGQNKALFKEFVKIGVFRGIFRCSDFNGRNVLVGLENQFSKQYLVSIDEGDIGKRLDILGGREKWLVNALNQDKSIIKEIIDEVLGKNETLIWKTMKKYCFSDDLCYEVKDNMRKLIYDLQQEGVEVEF